MFKLVDNYVVLLFSFNGLLDHWLYSRQTIFWTSLWRNRNKILKKEVKGFFREESPGRICWVNAYQDICHQ